jgi:hypothetical protein
MLSQQYTDANEIIGKTFTLCDKLLGSDQEDHHFNNIYTIEGLPESNIVDVTWVLKGKKDKMSYSKNYLLEMLNFGHWVLLPETSK